MKYLAAIILLTGIATICEAALTPEQARQVAELQANRKKLAELSGRLLKSPDDRELYREVIETTLAGYEQFYTRKRFEPTDRKNILVLKEVMEDIWAIADTLGDSDRSRLWSKGFDPYATLANSIVPGRHKREVPLVDPWGTPYKVFVHPENGRFKIVCAGEDKKFDPDNLSVPDPGYRGGQNKKAMSLATDIVFIDGDNFSSIFDYPKTAQSFLYEAVMRW